MFTNKQNAAANQPLSLSTRLMHWAARRGDDSGGGAIQDSNKTLNQFLVELDGFGSHQVLTIGATNNPDFRIQPSLRPGRFDRIIEIPLPNLEGRIDILKNTWKIQSPCRCQFHRDCAHDSVLVPAPTWLIWLMKSGLFAIREGRTTIQSEDIFRAIQRVYFGISKSQKILLDELWSTAYHEAGHAIVSYMRNKNRVCASGDNRANRQSTRLYGASKRRSVPSFAHQARAIDQHRNRAWRLCR
ncbi:MAG: AAA family ATPase [Candidatus Obscuribacter sp.]|nr:AAA family ATPase [Candidatus Obscuribacter sp.]